MKEMEFHLKLLRKIKFKEEPPTRKNDIVFVINDKTTSNNSKNPSTKNAPKPFGNISPCSSNFLINVSGFAGAVVLCLLVAMSNSSVFAAGEVATITGTIAQGLGFLAASLSTGFSALGAGIAVAAAAPAAIGAFSENEKNFGKSLIFVALGEGVAIYGLLISILIINKI